MLIIPYIKANIMKKYLFIVMALLLSACKNDEAVQKENAQDVTSAPIMEAKQNDGQEVLLSYSELTKFKALSIIEGLYDNTPALQINLSLPIDTNQKISQLIEVTQKSPVNDWAFSIYFYV